jgi:hypothetical protein
MGVIKRFKFKEGEKKKALQKRLDVLEQRSGMSYKAWEDDCSISQAWSQIGQPDNREYRQNERNQYTASFYCNEHEVKHAFADEDEFWADAWYEAHRELIYRAKQYIEENGLSLGEDVWLVQESEEDKILLSNFVPRFIPEINNYEKTQWWVSLVDEIPDGIKTRDDFTEDDDWI